MDVNSVASCFELYLERSDLRPNSIRFKRQAMKHFLKWFGDMPVGEVTLEMAEDYKVMLAKKATLHKRGRKKKTANGYLANIKPFWKWLQRHGVIKSNPFYGIRPYRTTAHRHTPFAVRELSWMARVACRLWRVRMCLGLLGMRRGEVMHLTVREINLSGPQAHILLGPKEQTSRSWPWGLKQRKVRMVALPEAMRFENATVALHRDIVRLQEDLPDNQPYICLEPKYYRRMIERQQAGTLTEDDVDDPTRNYQRHFAQMQRRAGVSPTKRFQELRAAFITKMIVAGGLEQACKAVGHSSVEITRHYDRRTEESLVAEIGKLAVDFYQNS
jgi:integrase